MNVPLEKFPDWRLWLWLFTKFSGCRIVVCWRFLRRFFLVSRNSQLFAISYFLICALCSTWRWLTDGWFGRHSRLRSIHSLFWIAVWCYGIPIPFLWSEWMRNCGWLNEGDVCSRRVNNLYWCLFVWLSMQIGNVWVGRTIRRQRINRFCRQHYWGISNVDPENFSSIVWIGYTSQTSFGHINQLDVCNK